MTDDLVKRLRICAPFDPDQAEAADRIEAQDAEIKLVMEINERLFAALREAREDIIDCHRARGSEYEGTIEEAVSYIDAALAGEKKDG